MNELQFHNPVDFDLILKTVNIFYLKRLNVALQHLPKLPRAGFIRACRTMSPKLLNVFLGTISCQVICCVSEQFQVHCNGLKCWFLDPTLKCLKQICVGLFHFGFLFKESDAPRKLRPVVQWSRLGFPTLGYVSSSPGNQLKHTDILDSCSLVRRQSLHAFSRTPPNNPDARNH